MRTEEHPDIPQWSDRVLALAGILKPLADKTSLGPDDLEQVAQQAAPWYNGTPPTHTTIRNLLRRFKEKGLDGLERDRYRNKGQSNLSPLLIQHVRITSLMNADQASKKSGATRRNTLARC